MKGVFSPFFILFILSLKMGMALENRTTTIPVNVGVVLDMDQWMGKMGLSCISMALSDFYASHDYYKTRLVLNTRDSKNDVVGAAAAGREIRGARRQVHVARQMANHAQGYAGGARRTSYADVVKRNQNSQTTVKAEQEGNG
ncbi:Glutamate receptor 2.1 like [Actinidia chinensis var. chinensis]|uniref:Glutamate receptor 2.1 like n=1 Tax=Actinidia chinensis var. chinensis TaxID=1590841 RepID=A0A2R6R4Q1_ACTCC|nr:Glutamate receptor 2.1 like [Actinidia chinensis var. chinensis]